MQPKVTDRVFAVCVAGANIKTREVNIKKRFALLYHLSFIVYHLAKLRFALINPIPKSEDAERG